MVFNSFNVSYWNPIAWNSITWIPITYYRPISELKDYPWIRSAQHLKAVNKYRRRVGQYQLKFSDDDMAELILLGDG